MEGRRRVVRIEIHYISESKSGTLAGFGSLHCRTDGDWWKSVEAVSERLELWGHGPEEAYRIASLKGSDIEDAP